MSFAFLSLVYLKTAKARGGEVRGENRDTEDDFQSSSLVPQSTKHMLRALCSDTLTKSQAFVSKHRWAPHAHSALRGRGMHTGAFPSPTPWSRLTSVFQASSWGILTLSSMPARRDGSI